VSQPEQFSQRYVYKISQQDVTSLAQVFGTLEQSKEELGIEEYSFSQSTLEQVSQSACKISFMKAGLTVPVVASYCAGGCNKLCVTWQATVPVVTTNCASPASYCAGGGYKLCVTSKLLCQ